MIRKIIIGLSLASFTVGAFGIDSMFQEIQEQCRAINSLENKIEFKRQLILRDKLTARSDAKIKVLEKQDHKLLIIEQSNIRIMKLCK